MNSIHEKVFAAFKGEYKRHLKSLREFLSVAERNGNISSIDLENAQRCAHTLKGAARAVNLPPIQNMAAGMELFFTEVREQKYFINDESVSVMNQVLNAIDEYASTCEKENTPPSPEDTIKTLYAFLNIKAGELTSPLLGRQSKSYTESPVTGQQHFGKPDMESIRREVLHVFYAEYRSRLETIRSLLFVMENEKPIRQQTLDEAFRAAHSLKGAARSAGLKPVHDMAHKTEAIFSLLNEDKLLFDKKIYDLVTRTLDAIEDYVVSCEQGSEPVLPSDLIIILDHFLGEEPPEKNVSLLSGREDLDANVIDQAIPVDYIRISTENLERIQKTSDQLMIVNFQRQDISEKIQSMERMLTDMARQWHNLSNSERKPLRSLESSPEYSRIAGHINSIIHQIQSLHKQTRELRQLHGVITRENNYLTEQIKEEVRSARMISAENIFKGFRKVVRDLARDEEKEIEFRISGMETRADRKVYQQLQDPLMHILRNAVSHGVEKHDERISLGKNVPAMISLDIKIENNRLQLTIEDDGRGIDYNRILEMAVNKGLIDSEKTADISAEELLRLIFMPGFSTMNMVTDLSGRGMGLSVVNESIKRLKGEIDIKSRNKRGTTIRIVVPLTISAHRLIIVKSNDHVYGIPVSGVECLARISSREFKTIEGKAVINLNGSLIPFSTLPDLLGDGKSIISAGKDVLQVIILKAGGDRLAIYADKLLSEQDVIIKDLPMPINGIPFFSGGFIQADGSACLILNPSVLIGSYKTSDKMMVSFEAPVVKTQSQTLRILVVDDSITTRTLEKSILEANGYDVNVAVDGIEGLQILKSKDMDLVITDIDMPRMNGFELITEMKKNNILKEIPVIIVTSMEDLRDKEKGLKLGADAYIVKQKFDQQDLLETVRQIL